MAYRRINLPLLRNFKENFGHLNVPYAFVVPMASNWDSVFLGLKLGNYVQRMRKLINKGNVFVEEDVKEALGLGLDVNTKIAKSEFYLSAFKIYKQLYPSHISVDK